MMTLGAMMAAALAVAVRADEGVSSFFDLTAIDIRCARSLVPVEHDMRDVPSRAEACRGVPRRLPTASKPARYRRNVSIADKQANTPQRRSW